MMDRDDYEPKQAGSLKEIERGDIRFEHVSFSYDGKRDVLKEISFEVKNGQTIAFVGHTGSGKSSIINLFMRFYEFDRGQILIDGQDIKDYSQEALRKSIGLVLQEPFLYHGTIASNIRMYHEELTDEDVRQVAAFVDVADFIESLPGGYDHPVTERGSTLSTGQRQLLAFARTIAAQPKILIWMSHCQYRPRDGRDDPKFSEEDAPRADNHCHCPSPFYHPRCRLHLCSR